MMFVVVFEQVPCCSLVGTLELLTQRYRGSALLVAGVLSELFVFVRVNSWWQLMIVA